MIRGKEETAFLPPARRFVPPTSVAAIERGPRVFLPAVEAEVFAAAGGGGPKSFGRRVVHEVRKGDGVRVVRVDEVMCYSHTGDAEVHDALRATRGGARYCHG